MMPVDHVRVAHPRDAALRPDVGGHALQRHHRDRAGVLGDLRLLGRDHVHDHAALEHLGHPALDARGAQLGGGGRVLVERHGVPSRVSGGPGPARRTFRPARHDTGAVTVAGTSAGRPVPAETAARGRHRRARRRPAAAVARVAARRVGDLEVRAAPGRCRRAAASARAGATAGPACRGRRRCARAGRSATDCSTSPSSPASPAGERCRGRRRRAGG